MTTLELERPARVAKQCGAQWPVLTVIRKTSGIQWIGNQPKNELKTFTCNIKCI
jgi:hypothetical protein